MRLVYEANMYVKFYECVCDVESADFASESASKANIFNNLQMK